MNRVPVARTTLAALALTALALASAFFTLPAPPAAAAGLPDLVVKVHAPATIRKNWYGNIWVEVRNIGQATASGPQGGILSDSVFFRTVSDPNIHITDIDSGDRNTTTCSFENARSGSPIDTSTCLTRPLAPGQAIYIQVSFQALQTGARSFSASVDLPQNRIAESNEGNNVANTTITVLP